MKIFLFRFRGELMALWGLGAFALGWPPRGSLPSLALLVAGLALRAWARRHIGPHSRGRTLACPERSVTGPYRYLRHPLYLANLLVAASLSFSLAGPTPKAFLLLLGPVLLYSLLARAETTFVERSGTRERTSPHDRSTGGWSSEWASFVPPLFSWVVLQFLAAP
jgi:protein-S-isoprenylcysteine O-methyltransferase Ste14